MLQSFLVVAPGQGLVEELHRQVGDDFRLIPLRSVNELEDSPDQRVAAVVIRVPGQHPLQETAPALTPPPPPAAATPESLTLEVRVGEMERKIIEDALARNNHRRQETADELGVSRVTLYNKMKKFGLL